MAKLSFMQETHVKCTQLLIFKILWALKKDALAGYANKGFYANARSRACNCYESSICKLLSLNKMLGYRGFIIRIVTAYERTYYVLNTPKLYSAFKFKKFPKTFKTTAMFTLNFQVLGHLLQFRMSRHYSLILQGNVFLVLLQS